MSEENVDMDTEKLADIDVVRHGLINLQVEGL